MINLGKVKPGSTIYIPFETFGNSSPAPITITGLATSDIKVFKNGSTTERASASGFTLLDTDGIDFDSLTGIHGVSIDLADNTTADFWTAGGKYFVVISDITVDSLTMRFIPVMFEIGYSGAILDTTIATLASQTSFTLTNGPAEDDALNGCDVVIHDIASAVQIGLAAVLDYTGATKTVTLAAATTFTAAAGDNISVMPRTNIYSVNGTLASAAGTVDANVVQIVGDTQSASDLKDFADAGYDPATNKVQGVVLVDTVTTLTNLPAISTGWISAAGISSAAANKIADHTRRRTQANVEASSDGDAVSLGSLYGLIQQGQESAASGTTLTVYKTDGTTSLGTKTLSTNAAADPVDGIS